MLLLLLAMLATLVLAGLVVVYVAFPHRGEDVPHVPWLGQLLRKGVDSAPTLHNTAEAGPPESGSGESEAAALGLDLTYGDDRRTVGRHQA
jgi:hypothetical protein